MVSDYVLELSRLKKYKSCKERPSHCLACRRPEWLLASLQQHMRSQSKREEMLFTPHDSNEVL